MAKVKLAIIYYSTYGTNHRMASEAAYAAEAAGAEVRLRKCRETAPQEVVDKQDGWKATAERTKDIEVATPKTGNGLTHIYSALRHGTVARQAWCARSSTRLDRSGRRAI